MTKYFTLLALSLMTLAVKGQNAKAIVGKWLNAEKDGKIEIYEAADGKFFGKLVWLKNQFEADGKTPRKDAKNKDAKLRERPLQNLVILTGFEFEDGKWKGGQIYDPKSGKTYSCVMKLADGKLEVRGYVGSPILGRTTVWTKAE